MRFIAFRAYHVSRAAGLEIPIGDFAADNPDAWSIQSPSAGSLQVGLRPSLHAQDLGRVCAQCAKPGGQCGNESGEQHDTRRRRDHIRVGCFDLVEKRPDRARRAESERDARTASERNHLTFPVFRGIFQAHDLLVLALRKNDPLVLAKNDPHQEHDEAKARTRKVSSTPKACGGWAWCHPRRGRIEPFAVPKSSQVPS